MECSKPPVGIFWFKIKQTLSWVSKSKGRSRREPVSKWKSVFKSGYKSKTTWIPIRQNGLTSQIGPLSLKVSKVHLIPTIDLVCLTGSCSRSLIMRRMLLVSACVSSWFASITRRWQPQRGTYRIQVSQEYSYEKRRTAIAQSVPSSNSLLTHQVEDLGSSNVQITSSCSTLIHWLSMREEFLVELRFKMRWGSISRAG